MDKLIHTSEGNLVEDNPYRIGRSVIRLSTNSGFVPPGTRGVIIAPNHTTSPEHVRVDWGKVSGEWNTKKRAIDFVD